MGFREKGHHQMAAEACPDLHGSISKRGFYGEKENIPIFSKTFQKRRSWKRVKPHASS